MHVDDERVSDKHGLLKLPELPVRERGETLLHLDQTAQRLYDLSLSQADINDVDSFGMSSQLDAT